MNFSVSAASFPALFESAARRFFETLLPLDQIGEALREKIIAEAETPEALFEAWMSALVQSVGKQGMVFRAVRVLRIEANAGTPCRIVAEGIGELIDPHRHALPPELRNPAISIDLHRSSEGAWTAQVRV